jgi:uncharacterized protein YyaL (SSP411 family)
MHVICKKLLQEREKKPAPFIDSKIIVSCNCQVINVLLQAGHTFRKDHFIKIACQTMDFLWDHCYKEGLLYRRFVDGQAKYVGNLDDYAWMMRACLTLYKYSHGALFYQRAQILLEDVLQHFFSDKGFYSTLEQEKGLLLRKVQRQDSSEPAGQSVLCSSLIEFAKITRAHRYQQALDVVLSAGTAFAYRFPENFLSLHHMHIRYQNPKACLMVIVLDPELSLKDELQHFLASNYLPFVTCVWKESSEIELFAEKPLIEGQTTIYLCSAQQCFSPVLRIEDVKKIISDL